MTNTGSILARSVKQKLASQARNPNILLDRNADIYAEIKAGGSPSAIGRKHGITRQRVHDIKKDIEASLYKMETENQEPVK